MIDPTHEYKTSASFTARCDSNAVKKFDPDYLGLQKYLNNPQYFQRVGSSTCEQYCIPFPLTDTIQMDFDAAQRIN